MTKLRALTSSTVFFFALLLAPNIFSDPSPFISASTMPTFGLFTAKYSLSTQSPDTMKVTYYHDDFASRGIHQATTINFKHASGATITFPGSYKLKNTSDASDLTHIDLNITASGKTGYAITIKLGKDTIAKGLGILDPDHQNSMLVSGWTSDTEPYGIAKYSIRGNDLIEGLYLSKMTPDHLGKDTAIGDTTNGFPGQYSLTTLEVSGRTWGPHDWRLEQRGNIVDLVWREKGAIISRGFGMIDPYDDQSIIVTYIPIKE